MPILLHAADLHLDSPFAGLSPDKAVQRRREQRELLTRLAELVRRHGVELVLLSGDVLDGAGLYADTGEALCRALGQMGVPVFLAPGNHDLAPLYDSLPLPDNVTVFRRETVESVELPGLNTVVHGRGFSSAAPAPFAGLGFTAPEDGKTHILCLHGDVGGTNPRYGPIPPEALAASRVTYAALGHVHQFSGLHRAGDTVWAYPGCPEGRGFDETGDKGVYLGQIDDRGQVSLEFVPLARRRYLTPTLDITGQDPEAALRAFLPTARGEDIVRLTLVGERDENNEPDLTALTALASGYFYSAALYDQTTLPQALWARQEEDTLTGLFLRAMARRIQAAGPDQRPLLERAARFGLAALEGREEPR